MGGMEGMSDMGSTAKLGGFDIQSIIKSLGGKGGKGGKGGLGGLSGMLRPEVRKAYKIEKLKPRVRPDATRVRITYGPYKIRASGAKGRVGNTFSMDPAGTGYQNLAGDDFPRDAMFVDSYTVLLNETFQKAYVDDGLYNHHIVWYDQSKTNPSFVSCNGKRAMTIPMSIFMGAGSEEIDGAYRHTGGEVKSGYYIGPKDVINFGMDIVNYQDRERTVYMANEIEYFTGKPADYTDAQTHVLMLGMCDGGSAMMGAMNIHPPKDKKQFTMTGSKPIVVEKEGYMVGTSGHLHDGGLHMVITINEKEVCDSQIEYGGPGHEQVQPNGKVWKTLARTIGCPAPIRVHKGDRIQMRAFFDFDKHPPRHSAHGEEAEGMALFGTTFVELKPDPTLGVNKPKSN